MPRMIAEGHRLRPATPEEEAQADLDEVRFREKSAFRPLLQRLQDVFESVPRENAPPAIRAHFRLLQASVQLSLAAPIPDIEAAKATIEAATLPNGNELPVPLKAYQAALLAEFDA